MGNTVKLKLEACFSPHLYEIYHDPDSIVVVIDIFRATSAICTAFHHGVAKMIPVATVEEAKHYKHEGFLAAAERDAIKVDGFDFGNSPYDFMSERVRNKTIVITTTNGTQAIEAARKAHRVVIGSFLNIDALCEWINKQGRNVTLLCSGWKNKFNLEDALFAGAVTEKLILSSKNYALGDSCLALQYLYQTGRTQPMKFLSKASHKERLARMNLKKDIRFCLQLNYTNVVPILDGKYLVCS